jgi:hypothetical protein
MPVKQILNRCTNPRMRFRWTINPYRGRSFQPLTLTEGGASPMRGMVMRLRRDPAGGDGDFFAQLTDGSIVRMNERGENLQLVADRASPGLRFGSPSLKAIRHRWVSLLCLWMLVIVRHAGQLHVRRATRAIEELGCVRVNRPRTAGQLSVDPRRNLATISPRSSTTARNRLKASSMVCCLSKINRSSSSRTLDIVLASRI